MLRVFSQSLGCPKNLVDTEHVLGSLGDIVMVQNIDEAELVFINTCAFIASAVEESIQSIVEIIDDIADIEDENKFIVVCGCLVGRYGEAELSEELPEVDLWLDTAHIDIWGALTAKAVQEHFNISLAPKEVCIEFMSPIASKNIRVETHTDILIDSNIEQCADILVDSNIGQCADILVDSTHDLNVSASLEQNADSSEILIDSDTEQYVNISVDVSADSNIVPNSEQNTTNMDNFANLNNTDSDHTEILVNVNTEQFVDIRVESSTDSSVDSNQETSVLIPPAGRLLSTGPSYAWLKIGEGCRHRCSFCTIPSIRGRHRSVSSELLVPEAKKLVDDGVKELILVAQDVTAWGTDLPEKDMRPLLDKLFALDGLERLRLMYLYPAGMTKDLLKYLSEAGDTFMPYFDIPLQHAHADILSKMGRPFSQNPEIVVDRIREYFPEAAIRTTFIVGFPGETDEHFDALYQFVNKTRFQQMGVFAYEKEDGTEAARMPNQVAQVLKQERRDELMELQAEISEEILESYAGQRLPILIDGVHPEWPGLYVGRTWFQAPVVDGITYVSAPPEDAEIQIGSIIEADITETQQYDLVALV